MRNIWIYKTIIKLLIEHRNFFQTSFLLRDVLRVVSTLPLNICKNGTKSDGVPRPVCCPPVYEDLAARTPVCPARTLPRVPTAP